MMNAIIESGERKFKVDLSAPIDISIPLRSGDDNPNAFGIQSPVFKPYEEDGFIGSVAAGGSVNCENLLINPHGNGTHTECVGHISNEKRTINGALTEFFFLAQLISATPVGNTVTATEVIPVLNKEVTALVIRTLPNGDSKRNKRYSGNNPAFLEPELCAQLAQRGILHLLVDLPSVDPERDNGLLSAHHAFWSYPEHTREKATITEMIFADNSIPDGLYLLNMQIASIESDASPSKPVLYRIADVL